MVRKLTIFCLVLCVCGLTMAGCGDDGKVDDPASDNASNSTANNSADADNQPEGGSCKCLGTGDADVYETCAGVSDGCAGLFVDDLACLASGDGAGVCRYLCFAEDVGTQNNCPAGFACEDSGLVGRFGTNFFICQAQ